MWACVFMRSGMARSMPTPFRKRTHPIPRRRSFPTPAVQKDPSDAVRSLFLYFDTKTLKSIAEITGGKAYGAASAGDLEEIFAGLPVQKTEKIETQEISVAFAATGALLATAAVGLSMLWHPLP